MTEPGYHTIADLLFRQGQDPDQNAIECPGLRPLTYRDLRQQVRSVVRTLNGMGFHRNDRIAVAVPAGPEVAVLSVAVMAGFTIISMNPQNREEEFSRLFRRLGVRAAIVQESVNSAAETAARQLDIPVIRLVPDKITAGIFTLGPGGEPSAGEPEFAIASDVVNILLTSGTTSEPKIISTLQKKLCLGRLQQSRVLKLTPADRCLHIIPYFHGAGIGLPLLGVLATGGTIVCTRNFIPADFPALLRDCRPTFFTAVPAIHQGILRRIRSIPPAELRGNSLRFILSSASSLPPDLSRELESLLGAPVIDMYASSETGTIAINYPPKAGSVGLPVIGTLAILDGDDTPLGPGAEGEIAVRGETVAEGYEGDSDENVSAFRGGWYRTGDTGYLDNDGYLFLTGRTRELINKGGQKIAPAEIDAELRRCAGVRDAMAFGVPDPVLGEEIAAIVIPSDVPVTEAMLRHALLDRVAPYKIPRRIWFVDEIPGTPNGKPLRQEGTRRYAGRTQEP